MVGLASRCCTGEGRINHVRGYIMFVAVKELAQFPMLRQGVGRCFCCNSELRRWGTFWDAQGSTTVGVFGGGGGWGCGKPWLFGLIGGALPPGLFLCGGPQV